MTTVHEKIDLTIRVDDEMGVALRVRTLSEQIDINLKNDIPAFAAALLKTWGERADEQAPVAHHDALAAIRRLVHTTVLLAEAAAHHGDHEALSDPSCTASIVNLTQSLEIARKALTGEAFHGDFLH